MPVPGPLPPWPGAWARSTAGLPRRRRPPRSPAPPVRTPRPPSLLGDSVRPWCSELHFRECLTAGGWSGLMGAKRALIVDDSKSARLFLARVLEKYDIDVDSAESAEAAIDYLTSNRPDVIFMDHLMPGMDGLQAVQHIKNDPRTATIPIMMYTSQEGELYLGQARALGAVGVLPKQIKPTDVSKVLYQLHLVPDRRSEEQSSFRPVHVRAEGEAPEPAGPMLSKPLTDSTLREHFADLRRALVAGIDTQTDRITSEVRALLLESLPQESAAQTPAAAAVPPPAPAAAPPWAWITACCALAI